MMRTKLTFNIPTFTLLTILLVGCGEATVDTIEPNSKAFLGISVSLEELSTRAVVPGTGFTNNATIDIVLKNENSSENDYNGVGHGIKKQFTFNSSTSVWNTSLSYELTIQRGVITAFYPSSLSNSVLTDNIKTLTPTVLSTASISVSDITPIQLNDETAVKIAPNEVDYMIGKGTPVSGNSPSSIVTMRHVMAMVAVQLTKDSSYTNSGTLTKIVLANAGSNVVLTKGSVNVATEAFNESNTSLTYTRDLVGYIHGENVAFLSYPAILFEDGLAQLTLTIDGTMHTIPLRGALDGSMSLEAGKCILYKVNISGTKLKLTGAFIIPWSNGTVINQDVKPVTPSVETAILTLNKEVPESDIPAMGGNYTLDITSNTDWKAIATNCKLSSTKGKGNGEVIVTVEGDPDGMQREVRVDFYTLLVGGQNAAKSWVGNQVRRDAYITVTTEVLSSLPALESNYILSVKSNTSWSAEGVNCSIYSDSSSGKAGVSNLYFTVPNNNSGQEKEVSIRLTSKDDISCATTWTTKQLSE